MVVPTHGERTMLKLRLKVAKARTLSSIFQSAVLVTHHLGRSTQPRADTWKREAGRGGPTDNDRRYFQVRLASICALVVLFSLLPYFSFATLFCIPFVCPEHI